MIAITTSSSISVKPDLRRVAQGFAPAPRVHFVCGKLMSLSGSERSAVHKNTRILEQSGLETQHRPRCRLAIFASEDVLSKRSPACVQSDRKPGGQGRSSGSRINRISRLPAPASPGTVACRLLKQTGDQRPRLQRRARDGFAPSSLFNRVP